LLEPRVEQDLLDFYKIEFASKNLISDRAGSGLTLGPERSKHTKVYCTFQIQI